MVDWNTFSIMLFDISLLQIEDHNMDSDEFDMRAPYIPHSDEMLVLSSDDLLWGAEVEPAVSPKNQLGYHR